MTEITAEMIARGRGLDPAVTGKRRKQAHNVRAARDKLASSTLANNPFEADMLRLYCLSRRSSIFAVAMLILVNGWALYLWLPLSVSIIWSLTAVMSIAALLAVARRFLALKDEDTRLKGWQTGLLVLEGVHGLVWISLIGILFFGAGGEAKTFVIFAVVLVSAISTIVCAAFPFAVYIGLVPIATLTAAYTALHYQQAGAAAISVLLFGALGCFVVLAQRLYDNAREGIQFRQEKEILIAEMEQAKANSDEARLRAEDANLAKSRFLATMSHELRTPLNAILGFSEVLKNELFGPHGVAAYKDYANDIHSSGEHLLTLINEILDLSRVEAGRQELREESFALAYVVDDCQHLLSMRARAKSIEMQFSIEENLPRVWADERAIRQVTLNLLSNAIKFTPQGGQVMIKVGWSSSGGQYVSITDTGPGIPEAEIPIVLSSFGRGSMAHKQAEEGTGLGLSIVKGLVELHGGIFTLRSKVREGTTVFFVLPPERVMAALPQIDPNAPADGDRRRRAPRYRQAA